MGVNKFENSQYPFAAFVTNLSKYSEGKLVGEWVAFPTTKEKMDAVLEKIGVGTGEYQEYFLSNYDCYINGLSGVLGEHENLSELNYLAGVLTDEADIEKYGTLIEAACIYSSVPVNIIEINSGSNGFFDRNTNSIGIKSGMSESQTFKTIIHETAHSLLHAEDDDKSRNQKEVEAESVAYAVCRHFGIDASDYSFGYIAGWSRNDDLKELRSSLELIQKTADVIITGIEEKQKVLDKGIENEKAVLYPGTDEPGNIIKM